MLRLPFEKHSDDIPKVTSEEIRAYEKHFGLLREWNPLAFLVSRRVLENPFASQYIDCLYISDFVDRHRGHLPVFDLGSGGGFPGIIFAIRYPNTGITVFEKNEKKVLFLGAVIADLRLKNVELRKAIPDKLGLGIYCARAFLSPEKLFSFFSRRAATKSCLAHCVGGKSLNSGPFKNFRKVVNEKYELPSGEGPRAMQLLELVPRGTYIYSTRS